MSYRFDFYVTHARDKKEALFLANKFVKKICTKEKMAQRIKEAALDIPTIRYVALPFERRFARIADRYSLYSLFNFKFIFWPQAHLLAMGNSGNYREEWDEVMGLPSGTISFDNHSDTDYAFEEWPQQIPFFADICEDYKTLLAAENHKMVLDKLCSRGDIPVAEIDEDDLPEKNFQSQVLDALYNHIYKTLDLLSFECEKPSEFFEVFCINGMKSQGQSLELSGEIQKVINEECNGFANKEDCLVPVFSENGKSLLRLFDFVPDENTESEPRKAIQKAIQEYLEAGKPKGSGSGSFIDMVQIIPDGWFRKYGLYPLRSQIHCEPVTFSPDEMPEL